MIDSRWVFQRPTAALVCRVSRPKIHVKGGESQHVDYGIFPHIQMHDVLLCLGLIGPTAPFSFASWVEPPEWAPVGPSAWSVAEVQGRSDEKDWSEENSSLAAEVYGKFLVLEKREKDRFRLAMQRLNRAMRGRPLVDVAIDLGIALEVLYLPDNNNELMYRMQVRAARYMGSTFADRDQISGLIKDLYRFRSKAVHTGKLSEKLGALDVKETLNKGFEFVSATIRTNDIEWLS